MKDSFRLVFTDNNMANPKKYRDATPNELYQAITGAARFHEKIAAKKQQEHELKHKMKFVLLRDPLIEKRFIVSTAIAA